MVPAYSNFAYAHKKSMAFPAPISPKLMIPEQFYVHIRYSEFSPKWIINVESTERNSFTFLEKYILYCANVMNVCTTSLKEHHNNELVNLRQTVWSLILGNRLKGRGAKGHGLHTGSFCGSLRTPKTVAVICSHKLAAVLWVVGYG
jgi:hypothetical protein